MHSFHFISRKEILEKKGTKYMYKDFEQHLAKMLNIFFYS